VGIESYIVEKGEDLREEWFKGGKRIGITAGLSTPLWEIEAVEREIRKILRRMEKDVKET
jgi:4-hydroxy-3-methylbut-2-enyl diphosphate reductase